MQFRPQRVGFRGLAAAVAFLCLAPGLGIAATANPKLLLLPIVVHSAEDPEYLRDGLYDMLTARFSRIGALDLVARSDSDQGTTDLTRALKLARKAGADFVLYGSFTRFGKGASLDVQCLATDENATHAPLREIFVHSGSIGEIIPDLDELAGKVSRFARGEIIPPASPAPADFAPASSTTDVQELFDRIEALEAALTQILEAGETSADLDGSIKELR